MSFKVKDLTVVVPGGSGWVDACTGWTRPECLVSIFEQDGRAVQLELAALKAQLRKAMTRV